MLTINVTDTINLLREVVSEFGTEHKPRTETNDGCQYVEDPRSLSLVPVCLIAQMFARLGILRALVHEDGYGQFSACFIGAGLWDRAAQMGVTFTEEAQSLARYAQANQDSGYSWGVSVESGIVSFVQEHARLALIEHGIYGTTSLRVSGKTPEQMLDDQHAQEAREREAEEAEAEAIRDMEDALSPVGTF